ncbi:MAG: CheR family methyltransferase [Thermodesulfobacteriota bacterium]
MTREEDRTGAFEELAQLVRKKTGLGWGPSGRARLEKAAAARASILSLEGPAAYLAFLRKNLEEWARLIPGLADGTTWFFRHPAQFRVLGGLLADLALRREERRLTMVSAGCATGEEAVSLAAAAWGSGLMKKNWEIRVLAADLNPEAVATLETGTFPTPAAGRMPAQAAGRWLRPKGDRLQVRPELMSLISPGVFNLLDFDHWPWPELLGQVDVVFIRNVFAGLDPEAGRLITRRLAELTATDGLLFTAPYEALPHGAAHFLPERWGGVLVNRRLAVKRKVNPGHASRKSRTDKGQARRPEPAPVTRFRLSGPQRGLIERAAGALAGGAPEKAWPRLEAALDLAAEKDDLCVPALGLAARTHLALGRFTEAGDLAGLINNLAAETPWAYVLLGEARAGEGRTGEAAEAFTSAADMLARNPEWAADPYFKTDPVLARFEDPAAMIKARLGEL